MIEGGIPGAGREADLELLLEWPDERAGIVRAGAISILLHIMFGIGLLELPSGAPAAPAAPVLTAELRRASTPLVAPPDITQKAPNRGPISRELNLQGLRAQTRLQAPPLPPPVPRPLAEHRPPAAAGPAIPEPPKAEPEERGEPLLARAQAPALGLPEAQPTQIQPVEKPKLAFETPGASMGSPQGSGVSGRGQVAPPKATLEEAIRTLARNPGGGGLTVGDPPPDSGFGGFNAPANPGRVGSSLELLSDPMGVDFRPYLIKILASVRRNWFAVIPESARFGRRGKVLIQFTISRDGNVPKLVITLPSGTEALDRAAVAGISASNPFPPLPSEFRGNQIHLQFSFLYNMSPN